jgi:hypothetical protein
MDSEEACKYHHEPVAVANRTDQLDSDNKCKPACQLPRAYRRCSEVRRSIWWFDGSIVVCPSGWVRGCWRAGPVATGVSPCPKNTKKIGDHREPTGAYI